MSVYCETCDNTMYKTGDRYRCGICHTEISIS